MEFLVISENKMKIMLTAEEVKRYGIESDASDYSDPEVRRAFWRILDRSSEECGFKFAGNKLLIQYYPSNSGAEIFVTRLGRISLAAERTISGAESVAMLSSKRMIYRFERLEDLRWVCRELSCRGEDITSEAYLSEDGCYYLLFEERCEVGGLSPFSVVSEFAEEIPCNMEIYIKEHSEPLSIGT